jgi:two-component system, OmpR family, sensor histidine kinase VicK
MDIIHLFICRLNSDNQSQTLALIAKIGKSLTAYHSKLKLLCLYDMIYGTMRILVAEDDKDTVVAYKRALEKRNHQIITTDNGEECLKIYRVEFNKVTSEGNVSEHIQPFDTVVLDYKMPDLDGMQVAKEILALNPRQRIIFTSAYVNEDLSDTANQHKQAVELLQKPFGQDALIEKIEGKGVEDAYAGSIKTITNPDEILQIYTNLLRSSKSELDLIFPSAESVYRDERIGIIQLIMEAAERGSLRIRILTPTDDRFYDQLRHRNIEIRHIQSWRNTRLNILIVDNEVALVLDLKNNLAESFIDAVGLATLFRDKLNVMSYVTIVDAFWNQVQLYDQIKQANEQLSLAHQKLRTHGKMHQDFINIAAHELKTPIQPLLLSSEVLRGLMPDEEAVQIIYRNSKKLQTLANNILDVTRIESKSLRLDKKRINLSDVILYVVKDIKTQMLNGKMKIIYEPQEIFIEADRERLTQVVSNLLSNAVKFTQEGTISIFAEITRAQESQDYREDEEKKIGSSGDGGEKQVIVSIRDTGVGISPEIKPKLFSKFTTKSFDGIGLGLFISKSIVEAHGGRIWAENNAAGEGATFAFSLPIISLSKGKRIGEQI